MGLRKKKKLVEREQRFTFSIYLKAKVLLPDYFARTDVDNEDDLQTSLYGGDIGLIGYELAKELLKQYKNEKRDLTRIRAISEVIELVANSENKRESDEVYEIMIALDNSEYTVDFLRWAIPFLGAYTKQILSHSVHIGYMFSNKAWKENKLV